MKVRALGATTYVRPRFSASLLLVTAAYLAVGLLTGAVWRFTGDNSWIEGYFHVPAALLTAFLAVVQCWFGLQVRHRFDPGEAMHPAWLCISGSAAFNVAGVLLSQILSEEAALNHWLASPGGPRQPPIRSAGADNSVAKPGASFYCP